MTPPEAPARDTDLRVSIDTDPVGRPQRLVLPGGREIRMRHDAMGNVLGITPPGRPEHRFSYNLRDAMVEYRPPVVPGLSQPETRYGYDADLRLTSVQRPDQVLVALDHSLATNGGGSRRGTQRRYRAHIR